MTNAIYPGVGLRGKIGPKKRKRKLYIPPKAGYGLSEKDVERQ